MRIFLRHAEEHFCVVLFLLMTLLGFVNVVVRYLTNYSLAATEELLTNGFLLLRCSVRRSLPSAGSIWR